MPLGCHLGIASGQLFRKDKIIIACGCIWAVAIKKKHATYGNKEL